MNASSKTPVLDLTWSLEVVRGRYAGRVYELDHGEIVIGNALDGQPGVDLKDQEGESPRRMAGRHAAIVSTAKDLVIRDLESPGGTFVNRQRLLAGQTRQLAPGDLIQVGSVQLAVKPVKAPPAGSPAQAGVPAPATASRPPTAPVSPASASAPSPSAASPSGTAKPLPGSRLEMPFVLPGGPTCRTWDDFLVLAAQQWNALRDELTSGRLSDYLRRAQRVDLLPRLDKSRTADDHLDEWLGRLPVTKPSAPELDVHPASLDIRAVGGGGLTRQTIRVTNVGYRLLRSTVRIEPISARWLRVGAEFPSGPFSTVDQTDLPVELDLPETLEQRLDAAIVIESNGGTVRVPVRVARAQAALAPAAAAVPIRIDLALLEGPIRARVAAIRPDARVFLGAGGAIALRLLVLVVGVMLHGAGDTRLSSVALALVAAFALTASFPALRRGEQRDVAAAALTGGSLGLLAAAVCFAVIQTIERILGSYSTSFWAIALLWGTIGALVALGSNYLIPYRPAAGEAAP
jgi:hypothetical protein